MLSLFFAGTKQREPLDNFDIRTTSEARKRAAPVVAGQRRTCNSAQTEAGGKAEPESGAEVESPREF